MGFDEGRIILDNENGNYVAGQTVFGRIVFEQGKPKDIHGIYVSCKGFCKVHWTTRKSRRVNGRTVSRTIHHESYEEYFKRKHFVIGSEDGDHHLQAGHHEYNFSCPIPNNCPSSFEGNYGHIRYRIKVVMVTSGIFSSNKDKKVAINIHAPLDLNQNPMCKDPIEFELTNSYCCWCISAGSSEIRVKLPVTGYCPGQVIQMEVSVANQSSVEIDELKFSMKQKITFEATTNPATKHDSNTIATITKGPIPAHTTRNWQVDMEVPAMVAYNLNACRYIDIDHYFKVSTEASGCHQGSEASHPIIIGNVPLAITQDVQHIPLQNQNVQAGSYYPPPPIIHQPLPHSPYPNGNYPKQTHTLEGESSSTPYPINGSPYPPNGSPQPSYGSPYSSKQNEFHGPTVAPYPAVHMPQPSPSSIRGYMDPYSSNSPGNLTDDPAPPYPVGDTVPSYPTSENAPTNNSLPPYPMSNTISPYPSKQSDSVSTYPTSNSKPPYPTSEGDSPHPKSGINSPYPITKSMPPASDFVDNLPKTDSIPPYPTSDPVPPYPTEGSVPSHPANNSVPPYPTSNAMPSLPTNMSVPTSDTAPPYLKNTSVSTPNITSGLLKTGTIGFAVPIFGDTSKAPSMPSVTNPAYSASPVRNPYASATAPEPSTPGSDAGIPAITISRSPAYNPEFMDVDKEIDNTQPK